MLNEFFEKKQIKLDVTCPKKGDKAKLINMVENKIKINNIGPFKIPSILNITPTNTQTNTKKII